MLLICRTYFPFSLSVLPSGRTLNQRKLLWSVLGTEFSFGIFLSCSGYQVRNSKSSFQNKMQCWSPRGPIPISLPIVLTACAWKQSIWTILALRKLHKQAVPHTSIPTAGRHNSTNLSHTCLHTLQNKQRKTNRSCQAMQKQKGLWGFSTEKCFVWGPALVGNRCHKHHPCSITLLSHN